MAVTPDQQDEMGADISLPRPFLVGLSVAGVVLVAAAALLWLRYGGLVYFERLASSFAGCF